jgi:hypothetical protein
MKSTSQIRVFLFSGLVLAAFIGGICVLDSQARPLLDSDIRLTKTGSPSEFTEAGQQIDYTFVVKNTSSMQLDSIEISDPMVDVSCPGSALASGSEMICSGVYEITELDMATGVVRNQATVTASYGRSTLNDIGCGCCRDDYEIIYVSASASFSILRGEVPATTIMLTKTGEPDTFKWPGETIAYTYRVENTGNTSIQGPITVTDDMLDVECPLGGLAPGQTMVCTAEYTTTEADMEAFSIVNTAVAEAGDDVTSTDSFEVTLESVPDLTLEYWQLIIYDLAVTNTGNIPFDGPISINDDLLDEWSCPEIEHLYPGDMVICAGYYRVRIHDVGGSINNCATAHAHLLDGTFTSNESCDTLSWVAPIHPCEPWPECVSEY